jgi:PST family polysaccharide transporter
MTLVGTSLLSGIAVVIKVLSLLAINKILAIFVGPAGYSVIGQFQNALTTITTLASSGVNSGVTKYTAEFNKHPSRQKVVWSTATLTGLAGTIVVALTLVAFAESVSFFLFKSREYTSSLIWAAACLPLFVLNTLLLAILNGKKEVMKFVLANIYNNIFLLITVGFGAWIFGLKGALISLALGQSISCIFTLIICWKEPWFKFSYLWIKFDLKMAKKLFHFTLMAVATSIFGPISQMIVRNHLIDMTSLTSAGYWEAVTRISSAYLLIIAMPLSVYFIPRIAETQSRVELRKEIINGYKLLIPAVISIAFLIFILREQLIRLLFSAEFHPMSSLFLFEMIGDVFRACGWLLSFYLLGKAMTRSFLFVEVFINLTFIGLAWVLIDIYGVLGPVLAHAINSAIFLILLLMIVKKNLSS